VAAPSPAPLLLLWDIDGTLLQRASLEHAQAIHHALGEVHGVEELHRHEVEAAGRTDGAIARDLLLATGIEPHAIDAGVEAVMRAAIEAYAQLCPADLSAKVTPGIPALLERLAAAGDFRMSLVTGNFEAVARLKLERAGVGGYFAPGQGGFGSDHEDRAELPRIARERAGGWPRERTVVIGDTPRDIACARADGVRVVAVTTGPYAAVDLTGADAIADSPQALEPILTDWV
jgi:phosphoglycolate phosphatase